MPSFADLLQQGAGHAWLFIPSAILLGALHGLEPGHSKTMMAAFIVAIRGTVGQAVLLGIAATISHTLIVWGIALGGLYFWRGLDAETAEPWFQMASAVIIISIALWMLSRTWQDQQGATAASGHHGNVRQIDTGHGVLTLEIVDLGAAARWRLSAQSGHGWPANDVTLETERPDGRQQRFAFASRGGYLESVEAIPEPREFMARVKLVHGGHSHDYDVAFVRGDGADHIHEEVRGLELATADHQDAHELAHANDIRHRFADRKVTTWQIVLFGLTGGLIPCPAAITVLLLCLQLKETALGAALVLCFSIGLALTLVAVGAAAALSVRHVGQRFPWFSNLARRAPYVSSLLIIAVGLYVGLHGWIGLMQAG
jgi:nickel/cobalt transporter (NicO) family protein